jgi:hypothetical protein
MDDKTFIHVIMNCKHVMWTWWWTSGFHKMLGSSWVAAQLAASQEGLSSMSEWVRYRSTVFE